MKQPVRPTPALQCTTTGPFVLPAPKTPNSVGESFAKTAQTEPQIGVQWRCGGALAEVLDGDGQVDEGARIVGRLVVGPVRVPVVAAVLPLIPFLYIGGRLYSLVTVIGRSGPANGTLSAASIL